MVKDEMVEAVLTAVQNEGMQLPPALKVEMQRVLLKSTARADQLHKVIPVRTDLGMCLDMCLGMCLDMYYRSI